MMCELVRANSCLAQLYLRSSRNDAHAIKIYKKALQAELTGHQCKVIWNFVEQNYSNGNQLNDDESVFPFDRI